MTTALAQLRHLYAQMLAGEVIDTAEAARGLLGPAIERLEVQQHETAAEFERLRTELFGPEMWPGGPRVKPEEGP